jgi:tetratricopeptide (TPR) repeat protein
MLLGANSHSEPTVAKSREMTIFHLLGQQRFAEAYQLLKMEAPDLLPTQYNMALCHHWAGDHQEALLCLERAQRLMTWITDRPSETTDSLLKTIKAKQAKLNDHLQPVIQEYAEVNCTMIADGITRLSTDCWLALGQYYKVIETATPIAYKGYKNIADAMEIAQRTLNHE